MAIDPNYIIPVAIYDRNITERQIEDQAVKYLELRDIATDSFPYGLFDFPYLYNDHFSAGAVSVNLVGKNILIGWTNPLHTDFDYVTVYYTINGGTVGSKRVSDSNQILIEGVSVYLDDRIDVVVAYMSNLRYSYDNSPPIQYDTFYKHDLANRMRTYDTSSQKYDTYGLVYDEYLPYPAFCADNVYTGRIEYAESEYTAYYVTKKRDIDIDEIDTLGLEYNNYDESHILNKLEVSVVDGALYVEWDNKEDIQYVNIYYNIRGTHKYGTLVVSAGLTNVQKIIDITEEQEYIIHLCLLTTSGEYLYPEHLYKGEMYPDETQLVDKTEYPDGEYPDIYNTLFPDEDQFLEGLEETPIYNRYNTIIASVIPNIKKVCDIVTPKVPEYLRDGDNLVQEYACLISESVYSIDRDSYITSAEYSAIKDLPLTEEMRNIYDMNNTFMFKTLMNFKGTEADFQYLRKVTGQNLVLEERSNNPDIDPCDIGTSLEVTIDDDFKSIGNEYEITGLLQSMIHDRTHICISEAWFHAKFNVEDTDSGGEDDDMDAITVEKMIPFVYDEPNMGLKYDIEGFVYTGKYDMLLPAQYDQEFLTFTP